MDGHRFDDLTRALAAGSSRRRAIGLLVGAFGGVLAGGRGAAAQGCRRLGRRCADDRPCCANLACLEGACVPAAVEQVATCVPPFSACDGSQTCCPGASCAGGVCCPIGLACGDVCCGNGTVCTNGVCATPGGRFLCPAGQRLCGAAGCRDLASDPNNCGSCGRACPSGRCTNGSCCTPATCQAGQCGSRSDGCGGTLQCGACAAPGTCGGGGTPGVCGCADDGAACAGRACGTAVNNCGATVVCGGACPRGQACGADGQCACTAESCTGCCDANGVCELGAFLDVCGAGGGRARTAPSSALTPGAARGRAPTTKRAGRDLLGHTALL